MTTTAPCTLCHGAGTIPAYDLAEKRCLPTKCPRCDGKGKLVTR